MPQAPPREEADVCSLPQDRVPLCGREPQVPRREGRARQSPQQPTAEGHAGSGLRILTGARPLETGGKAGCHLSGTDTEQRGRRPLGVLRLTSLSCRPHRPEGEAQLKAGPQEPEAPLPGDRAAACPDGVRVL